MSSDTELMAPALYVEISEDEEFDMNLPPVTGNEYIRRVRIEAQHCPDIVVAKLDANRFSNKQTLKVDSKGCQPAPKGYAPSLAWQRQQVADFSDLRNWLARFRASNKFKNKKNDDNLQFPEIDDDVGWCRLCFGNKLQRQLARQNESFAQHSEGKLQPRQEDSDGIQPLVSIVTLMSQPLVEQVLDYHIGWFEATGFTTEQGCWFYALLACLEKPLTPEACSSLRTLTRQCANLRATLDCKDPLLHHLNVLICLVARYFGQSDLADNEK